MQKIGEKEPIENITSFQNVVQTVNKVSNVSRSRLGIKVFKVSRDIAAFVMRCWR